MLFQSFVSHLIIFYMLPLTLVDADTVRVLEYTLTGSHGQLEAYLDRHPDEIDRKDSKHGNSPLHIAAYRGNTLKVDVLIRKSADLDLRDIFGNAALHYAINQGLKEVVHMLLKAGADVDMANHRGTTPLHAAAAMNNVPICRLLIKYSANPVLLDLNHKRAMDLTSNAIIIECIEKAIEYHKQGLKAPPNENLNWMGFGLGLGVGMGLAIVKQRMDFLEECRLAEIKRKEDEVIARRLAAAEEKARRGKAFQRRLLDFK